MEYVRGKGTSMIYVIDDGKLINILTYLEPVCAIMVGWDKLMFLLWVDPIFIANTKMESNLSEAAPN